MEHFKLYVLLNASPDSRMLLTNSKNLSSAATFDEAFSIGKHDKSSLSFSIAEKLDTGEHNPYLDHLLPESVIALDLVDRKPIHDQNQGWAEGLLIKYKIKGRQPRISKEMSIWDFVCEDYASAVYSKEAQGLSIDKTGTLQELTEEILGVSRKNMKYESLNINYATNVRSYEGRSSFQNRYPYIIFSDKYLNEFIGTTPQPFITFIRPSKMVSHSNDPLENDYDLQFDLLNSSFRYGDGEAPVELAFNLVQKGPGISGSVEKDRDIYILEGNSVGVSKTIVLPFKLHDETETLELQLSQPTGSNWYNEPDGTSNGIYNISIANYKITRNKDFLVDQTYTDPLHLNNLENLKEFLGYDGLVGYQDMKMTFTIENSNLYNAIVELATLFEAEVRFDYEDNAFYYIKTSAKSYRGYKVHPDINLLSISRPETSSDFASIFHIRGSDDVNSIIPSVPVEWREYFLRCVENNFTSIPSNSFFANYSTDPEQGETYSTIAAKYLIPNLSNKSTFYERKMEIEKFAKQMDRVPNFDGTVYDFSYFANEGLINSVHYEELMHKLYNDLRKINIAANVKSYQYYTILSKYSAQQTQMAYYIQGIHNEQKFQYQSSQKLDSVRNPSAPRPYTSAWVSLKNQIDASQSQEQDFKDNLNNLVGYTNNGLNINEGSFLFNIFHLFGYENPNKNAVQHLIDENQKARDEKLTERENIEKEINRIQIIMHMNTYLSITMTRLIDENIISEEELTSLGISKTKSVSTLIPKERDALVSYLINNETQRKAFYQVVQGDASPQNFENSVLEIELAGYQSRLERTYVYLGFNDTDYYNYEGSLEIEAALLAKLKDDLPESLTSLSIESLYDILFNKEYPGNIVRAKEDLLQDLYTKYESFSIEGIYENSDEVDSYGLLEQGLRAFVYFSKPKVEYSVSVIEIGAIEGYKDLPLIEVGEKILLGSDLYKSYQTNEETEYLIVNEFSLKLREPDSLNLQVTQDDETDRLIKAMFQSLNLVKLEPYKQKSNLVLPIPREIMAIGAIQPYYSNQSSEDDPTNLISNNRFLFKDMYVKVREPLQAY